jgi:hypothetical protein
MADGGSSVTREESSNGLLYPRVRWRGGSQVHHDGMVTAWRGVRRRRDWLGGHGRRSWPMASGGQLKAVVPGLWGCGAWRRCIGTRTSVRGPGELTVAGVPRHAGPAEPRGDTRSRRALWSARSQNSSNGHALTLFFSKKLNCSGQTLEYQSCRSLDPLQLLQRAYGLFLNQLCTNLLFSGRL